METLAVPSQFFTGTIGDVAQLREFGDVRADLDAGVAGTVPALDAGQVVLHMEIQATFAIRLFQRDRLHAGFAVDLLGNNFPAPAIDYQRSVLSDKAQAMVSSIGAIVDADRVIPHDREIVESIDRLQEVGRLTGVIRIAELAT